jgi:hypothetical protein
MRTVFDAALWYAGQGIPVFPCHGNIDGLCACGAVDAQTGNPCDQQGKHPIGELVPNGFKDGSTDRDTVEGWFRDHPHRLIGCAHFNVLDFDLYQDGVADFYAKVKDSLDGGLVARTGNGGVHTYYAGDPSLSQSDRVFPDGVHVRIAGKGYVILPGSAPLPPSPLTPELKPGGVYEWEDEKRVAAGGLSKAPPMPEQVSVLLAQPPERDIAPVKVAPGDGTAYGRKALGEEIIATGTTKPSGRNNQLNRSAFALGQLEAGGELPVGVAEAALAEAAKIAQLPADETAKTIRSGMAAGRKQPRSAPDLHVVTDPDEWEWVPASLIPPRSIEFVDKPLLQRAAFHLLVGRKGAGKGTWLAAQAAKTTRGEFGEKPTVLWIATEDSAAIDIVPRLMAAQADLSRVQILRKHWLRLPTDIPSLCKHIEQFGDIGMVVIDPISNHMEVGKSSNLDNDVRDAISPLNDLSDEYDLILLAMRHLSEKEAKGGTLAAILGASAWPQTPRAVLAVAVDNDDPSIRHVQVVGGNRLPPDTTGRAYQLVGVLLPGFKEEVTLMHKIGESMKDVESLLREGGKESSKSEQAREMILDLLDAASEPQKTDVVVADVARETGLAAGTVRNQFTKLKDQGLVRFVPENKPDGTFDYWRVTRTTAPRPSAATRAVSSPNPATDSMDELRSHYRGAA